MLLALLGLPNRGKSTLLNAATSASAPVAPYPFTTIDPNKGIAFATMPCPHVEFGLSKCDPRNAPCIKGVRQVPVNMVDVAGLVPGAHEGKGMGFEFLSDAAPADVFIVVADASGAADAEGNLGTPGSHDPVEDVKVVIDEFDHWLALILKRNADKNKTKPLAALAESLSGLRIAPEVLPQVVDKLEMQPRFDFWKAEDRLAVARGIRAKAKPIVIAANKADSPLAKANIERIKAAYPDLKVVAVAADAELALKKAAAKGWAEWDGQTLVLKTDGVPAPVVDALKKIQLITQANHGTGVRELINTAVFDVGQRVAAFPVEDESKYANNKGEVLPDAVLMDKGGSPVDLAAAVHTDLAKGFLYAINARTKQRLGKEYAIRNGDVVRIVSAR